MITIRSIEIMKKRALISVSDKDEFNPFAKNRRIRI